MAESSSAQSLEGVLELINVAVPAAAAALVKNLRRDTAVVKSRCSLFTVILLFGKSLLELAKFRGEQETFRESEHVSG